MNEMYEYPTCLKLTDNMMFEDMRDKQLFKVFEKYFDERENFEKEQEYKAIIKDSKNKAVLVYWLMLAKFRYFKLLTNNNFYSIDLINEIDSLLEETMLNIEKFDEDIKVLIKETNLTFAFDKTGLIPYNENLEVVTHIQSLIEALSNIDKIEIPSSKDKKRYELKSNLNAQLLFYRSTTMKNIDYKFYKNAKFIRKFLLVNNLRHKSDYKIYEDNIKLFTEKNYGFRISKVYIALTYMPIITKFLLKSE